MSQTTHQIGSYARRTVPRYTSYPTAPHFSDSIGPVEYGAWLRALDTREPVSLYLHVPYCRAICHYCGCHTKAALRDDPIIDYAEGLVAEIALVASRLPGRLPVSHIHWGGGTPGLLPADSLAAVMSALRAAFRILPTVEHAIELDPRYVTADLARRLKDHGVTRVSLGVQDFDADVQIAMGRVQPVAVVAQAVTNLRAAGLDAINFDLMYGLPGQTPQTVLATVAETVAMAPSRIALFGYAHVPWMKKNQRLIDEAALPGPNARLELEAVARTALVTAGYESVGLDHFAHPGDEMAIAQREKRLARNFQGYTTDSATTLIGLGASSIGRLPGGYIQNAADTGGWRRAIADGILPTARGIALSDDDRLRGAIIERLMCDDMVDLAALAGAHGAEPGMFVDEIAALDELRRDGLVEIDDWEIRITEPGRPFVRVAAAIFDTYLTKGVARHSVAV